MTTGYQPVKQSNSATQLQQLYPDFGKGDGCQKEVCKRINNIFQNIISKVSKDGYYLIQNSPKGKHSPKGKPQVVFIVKSENDFNTLKNNLIKQKMYIGQKWQATHLSRGGDKGKWQIILYGGDTFRILQKNGASLPSEWGEGNNAHLHKDYLNVMDKLAKENALRKSQAHHHAIEQSKPSMDEHPVDEKAVDLYVNVAITFIRDAEADKFGITKSSDNNDQFRFSFANKEKMEKFVWTIDVRFKINELLFWQRDDTKNSITLSAVQSEKILGLDSSDTSDNNLQWRTMQKVVEKLKKSFTN